MGAGDGQEVTAMIPAGLWESPAKWALKFY